MKVMRRAALVFALCFVATGIAVAEDVTDGSLIFQRAIDDFKAKRFDRLEQTANDYLSTRSLTRNGNWRLGAFYDALLNPWALVGAGDAGALDRVESGLRAWISDHPESRAAHIALANVEIRRGWLKRGTGFAGSVTPEGWQGLADQVERAYATLMDARPFASDDPQWHATRLHVALAAGIPARQFDEMAAEALDRVPNYVGTNTEILNRRLPKWGGSWPAVDDAIDDLVARTSKQSGQSAYARGYWHVATVDLKWRLFQTSLAKWPRMKQGFEDIVARHPSDANLNAFAAFACLAHDMPTLTAVVERLQTRLIGAVWEPMTSLKGCLDAVEQQRRLPEDLAHYAKPTPRPAELVERDAIRTTSGDDLIAGRFGALEATHGILVSRRETTSSGDWKLGSFYEGLFANELVFAGRRVDDPDYDAVGARLDAWLVAAPGSKAAAIAQARLSWLKAWKALNPPQDGTPKEVRSAEAFSLLAKARAQLEAVRGAADADPEWWAVMLWVAGNDAWDDKAYDALMSDALSRAPTYAGILTAALSRGVWTRMEPGRLESVIDAAVAAVPADQSAQVYARSYLFHSERRRSGDLFTKTRASWPTIKLGFERIVAERPTDWNLNAFAKFACMAKDRETARALLQRLDGRIIETRWDEWRAPTACAAWAQAKG